MRADESVYLDDFKVHSDEISIGKTGCVMPLQILPGLKDCVKCHQLCALKKKHVLINISNAFNLLNMLKKINTDKMVFYVPSYHTGSSI